MTRLNRPQHDNTILSGYIVHYKYRKKNKEKRFTNLLTGPVLPNRPTRILNAGKAFVTSDRNHTLSREFDRNISAMIFTDFQWKCVCVCV